MKLTFSKRCSCPYSSCPPLTSLLRLLLIAHYFQGSHGQTPRVERLSPGSTLQANQTLLSTNRSFALGFFSLLPDRNYLGVYYGFSNTTHIWVANRNDPAKNGASFTFSSDGNMLISNPDQSIVWMSGTGGMNISSMVMEESGNVVLNHHSGKVIWQSFDYPTDTLVPGMSMYLGRSNLTSSKSLVDLADGRFSIHFLQTTETVAMWSSSKEYWTSGTWNGYTFSNNPRMTRYDNLSLLNDSGDPHFLWNGKDNIRYLRCTIESDGNYRLRSWDTVYSKWSNMWTGPNDPCQVYRLCGENGICNSDSVPFCSCPQGFKPVDLTGWSQGDWSLGCVASTTQSLRNHNSSRVWITGLGVAAGCAVLLLIAFLLHQILLRERTVERQSSEYIPGMLKKFSYTELRTATNNFREMIGTGAFASVYKGCLPDQTKVGVKKLRNMEEGDKGFRAEVKTIGMIQHVNLVRLRGFCADNKHRLLVYDYMPNGSLNSLLFSKPGAQQQVILDWDTRFSIALGTARGIAYLHEECTKCIIHFDIKPENILLDANFCAKVSDFGLAKLMGREFSRVITSMRGTRGYLAPEWLSGLPVTAKADVYSYGMTLLEIVSGRRNVDVKSSLDKWFFPLWACQRARLGDFSSLADSKLCENFNEEQLRKAVLVSLWCIQDEETSRPTMGRVLQMLDGRLDVADPPYPKSLLLLEVESIHSPLQLSMLQIEGKDELADMNNLYNR